MVLVFFAPPELAEVLLPRPQPGIGASKQVVVVFAAPPDTPRQIFMSRDPQTVKMDENGVFFPRMRQTKTSPPRMLMDDPLKIG